MSLSSNKNFIAQTCISAPGKVLVAGGYLVLDQAYSGLVIGTDSRFYTTITSRSAASDGVTATKKIYVHSPQFLDGQWNYTYTSKGVEAEGQGPRNKYVEYAIALTLSVASFASKDFASRFGNQLDILIVGHNDFYSQRPQLESLSLPISTGSLASLDPFCPTLTTIADVHKTGLGSSAAMITSLVSSLLVHFGAISISANNTSAPSNSDIQLAHNMSQFVHCLAQGKVGSGFDVSSAVYGSHLYKRFAPRVLDSLMSRCEEAGVNGVSGSEIWKVVKEEEWDSRVESVGLPRGVKLMLADVDCGSSTPKLVSGVLGWRKAFPKESLALWIELDKWNMEVARTLQVLAGKDDGIEGGVYGQALKVCSESKAESWGSSSNQVVQLFGHVYEAFTNVRRLLRKMSELAGVPVEPESQTRLLDSISTLNGVVMTGVPGAGGFDAIFTLVIEVPRKSTNRDDVERVWSKWTESNVGPLLAGASGNGLSRETVENVPGLARFFV
ncbi:UNVERIFIED_CONTAM: phosphomevalonate kinase [Siphonaria sp. JEL0065]|nr:phosphomevalonate kinase [Siphonaria sp. JEL0065]